MRYDYDEKRDTLYCIVRDGDGLCIEDSPSVHTYIDDNTKNPYGFSISRYSMYKHTILNIPRLGAFVLPPLVSLRHYKSLEHLGLKLGLL